MSFLTNPRSLYIVRLVQFSFGLAFLVLICWSGVHRGWWKWWKEINGALAVGVIASLFTFAITLHGIITSHLKKNPFSSGSTMRSALRLAAEAVIFLLWIASATLLLRHPSGCELVDNVCVHSSGGVRGESISLDRQPLTQWDAAIAFSFVEIVTFVLSAFLVLKEDRAKKAPGGASFA